MAYWPARLPPRAGAPFHAPYNLAGASYQLGRSWSRSPVAVPLAAGRRLALRVVYLHTRHQGRLSGAVSAVWALCRRTCSSWTSLRRASSSSAWACTWAWRVVTRASRLLSGPFRGWSFSSSSTSQRYGGVSSLWATSSPALMRLRMVSVDTPRRCAASPIDTFSSVPPHNPNCNIIGICQGNRLGAAWASCGGFRGAPW